MFAKSTTYCVVFLAGTLMVSSACSSSSNPAGPSGQTQSSNASGTVTVSVNPNPVPFSGQPITDEPDCAGRSNTWYYDLNLGETGGEPVTFHSRIDAFDGFVKNNLKGLSISVPPGGSITLSTRWCSSTNARHTAQHTFTGTDARGNSITLQSPVVSLMANR